MLLFLKKKCAVKKNRLLLLALLFTAGIVKAQPAPMGKPAEDSLHHIIESNAQDSNKVHAFYWLSRGTTLSNTSESVELGNKGS
jgi:hypothetical protein